AGGQHHPGGARLLELGDEFLERARAKRAVGRDRGDRLGVLVIDDGRMSVPHQPSDDIAAHPPQADHAELHFFDSLEIGSIHLETLRGCRGSGGELPLPWGEVGMRRYGLSMERNPSPGSPEAIRPLPMGEVTKRAHPASIAMYPALVQRTSDCGLERFQAGFKIAFEMHAQRAPA